MASKKMTMSQLASLAKAAAARVDPEADANLRKMAQVGVGLVKREIQNMHAVDTSAMLNSTTAESVGKDIILIGPTVEYAAFVALGTSRMPARPFHIVAAHNLKSQMGDFGLNLGL